MELPRTSSGRNFFLFLITVLTILTVVYSPWLFFGKTYYLADITFYFEPFCNYLRQSVLAGRLPLWNPYLYCGMAQMAVPSPGILYPFTWLFVAAPFSQALALYMVLHQLIAAAGTYLLVISFGWGAFPALVAAIIISMCGYMFSVPNNFTLVSTASWFPLLLFAVRRVSGQLTRQNVLAAMLVVFATFMMVAAGRPEIFVPAFLMVGLYVLLDAFVGTRRDVLSLAAKLAALLSGVIMTLPIILPAIEWVHVSPRSHGLELKWVLMWSANWYDCLCLLLAQPLGDLTHLGSRFLSLAAGRAHSLPFLSTAYLGPVAFTLAVWGMSDKTWKWRWLVLFLTAGSLLMSLGEHTPVAGWVSSLSPAFSSFRYPVKLLIFVVFGLAALAARGALLAWNRRTTIAMQMTTLTIWLLGLLLGGVFLLSPQLSLLTLRFPWLVGVPVNMEVMQAAQHAFGMSICFTCALAIAVCVVNWLYQVKRIDAITYAPVLVAALAASLLTPAQTYEMHPGIADYYDRPSLTAQKWHELSKADDANGGLFMYRAQQMYFDPLTCPPWFNHEQKIQFQEGFFLFARKLMLPNCNMDFGVPYAFGYEAAEVGIFKTMFSNCLSQSTQNREHDKIKSSDAPIARFCRITASKYIMTQLMYGEDLKPLPPLDSKFFAQLIEDRKNNFRIYHCLDVLPRVYFADSVKFIDDVNQYVNLVIDGKSNEQLADTYLEAKAGEIVPLQFGATNQRKIQFSSDRPEYIALNVETTTPALLVLGDQYYPGWNAYLDGLPVKVYRANAFARAVFVPGGHHRVEFKYLPLSLFAGLMAAGAVTLALALLFLFAAARHNGKLSVRTGPRSSVG